MHQDKEKAPAGQGEGHDTRKVNQMSNTNDISTLIPIRDHDGQQVASGRDLHSFLDVGRDYPTWFKQMVGYGFTEGQDFTPVLGESTGGRPSVDHAVTFDMAKELGMIQRTDKGKQIRQYFIEVEKNGKAVEPTFEEKALEVFTTLREMVAAKDEHIAVLEPKARAWDHIVSSAGSWSFNDAAKSLFEHKQIVIGEKRLFNRCVAWGYLYRDHKGRPHVYQRYLEQGLFTVKARTYTDQETGKVLESSAPQVRITGKGLDAIYRRLTDGQLEVSA